MNNILSRVSAAVFFGVSSLPVCAEVLRFDGLCDISAAAPLDGHTFLAASDEENTLFSFDSSGGAPIARRDLNAMLGLSGRSAEIDIEAAARGPDRVWWIGSHQSFKPDRQMIFATNLPHPTLDDLEVVVPPQSLLRALQEAKVDFGIWHPMTFLEEPDYGGLNIEAAAIGPGGRLWIGLRTPLDGPNGVTGSAIVIELDVSQEIFVASAKRLDLAGRGIRAMSSTGSGFLILARDETGSDTGQVYRWVPGHSPEALQIEPEFLHNPEAMVTFPDGLLILSDDGSAMRSTMGGRQMRCKAWTRTRHPDQDDLIFTEGIWRGLPNKERAVQVNTNQ